MAFLPGFLVVFWGYGASSRGASSLSSDFRRWGLAGVLFVMVQPLCPVSTGCFCASFVPLAVAYSFGIFGLAS